MSFGTESLIEEACLEYLGELRWDIKYGPDLAPGEPASERVSFADVVLVGRLRTAVAKHNPDLPAAAVDDVVATVLRAESQNLLEENWRLHRLVIEGVPVQHRRDDVIVDDIAQLVDWANPDENDWLALNQFTVVEQGHNRRPDVVLFVNGLPLAVIELKNPGDENATLKGAFNQLQTYKAEIPSLFASNAVVVVSDGVGAKMAALSAPWEHYAPWKTIDGERLADAGLPQLEVLVRGVFDHERFLDLVRNFVVFSDESGGLVKRVAKYHQFWAVRAAVDSTVAASTGGDGRAGVVWHTQGSGKSLEMLFYAAKVIRHPAMANPTLVLLTDRNDLDDQLFDEVFAAARTVPETPVQATSRENLQQLLRRASGGIVFTTIQKFAPEAKGDRYPLLSDRRNIVVIADEAHRSQYDFIDGFARHLRDGLPNASFIGFTGTPIDFDDKSTRQVFGDYVSVYDLTQAVEDEATVRIYYEARLAKVALKDEEIEGLDESFEEATEGEESDTKRKLKSRWARVEALVGSEERIERVAKDIVEHWEARREVLEGKAMVVCMSRRICAALYAKIAELRPDWVTEDDATGKVKVIITGGPMDDDDIKKHVRPKKALRDVKARAKDVDDELELVIVRDMWLTGFDSPSMHTMYVDKPMRGAALMQAIARINRTFRDKPGGLVVDYLGIADALRRALASYSAQDREEAGIPIEQALKFLKEKHEVVTTILHGQDWSGGISGKSGKYLAALASTTDFVLGDSERRTRFVEQTGLLVKAFALCVPNPAAMALRDSIGFFQDVRSQILKLSAAGETGSGRADEDLDTAISQILSEAVASEGVIDIYAAAGLSKPDISILSDEFLEDVKRLPQKNLQFELLRKLLADEIKQVSRTNVVQERKFSELLQNAIISYQNRALSSAEIINELVKLAQELRDAHGRGEQLGLNDAELAFYDAVHQNDSAVLELGDEVLRDIVVDLVETVKRNATVDWELKEQVRAKLRSTVRRVLLRHDYPPDKCEAATNLVLEQAELYAKDLTGIGAA